MYTRRYISRVFVIRTEQHTCVCAEKEYQLDATKWFIALIMCSTCFGYFYAHHQELETIGVLLPPMVCSSWLLVVGGQEQDSRYVSRKRDVALIICSTCFGYFYAHHQELETICVLLPPMVCSAWLRVVGG